MIGSLRGSVNVITGCGSGLGRSVAKWFLHKGVKAVLAVDRRFDTDIRDHLGVDDDDDRLQLSENDTFDEKKATISFENFVSKFGPIDNLINVAGICSARALYSPLSKNVFSTPDCEMIFKFNVLGNMVYTNLFVEHVARVQRDNEESKKNIRCIINTSSISSNHPSGGQVPYAGTSSALDSMTLTSARELSKHNIRVNSINVGYFKSKLLYACGLDQISFIEKFITLYPNRSGHPDEFAHLVQTIVENKMLNGSCIALDAGAHEVNILKLSIDPEKMIQYSKDSKVDRIL